MSKKILLIDDEKTFKDAFKIKAQSKGYQLAWAKSFDTMREKLPSIVTKITAVILDVKCLISDNQEIEKPDFIGMAINYLNQNYPDVPRLILTGDEKAIDGIRMFFNADTEDVYTKSPKDLDLLFKKIEFHQSNFQTRLLKGEQKCILEFIKQEEGKKIEFKSSLRFSINDNALDKSLEFESFKNIAAFLNSDGGDLLIGIDDDKKILGLENSDFTTFNRDNKQDALKLHIDNLIETYFGNAVHRVLNVSLVTIDNKTICRINVEGRYQEPIFVKKKTINQKAYNAFYIRRSSSARELRGDEIDQYIKGHWNENL
ncbi:Putative DNA-binding domain-containing protein [Zunongwangia mangrovi]|uniref:Putative DNA-binding domain-containing protein n=1 Tax=Zunongwangia mangrovi TaxID=1334022 RepID=A0A1I1J0W1_9FLAO|nr:ATP-binding protein [Zunongwangia mangrovi]SFC39090.1 Putative DNA-binding domain-containing protein [Zunongwangia mangrovi]